MSVPAAFWASMVRVTSDPDAAVAGTVMFTVPFAAPPHPAATVTEPGDDKA